MPSTELIPMRDVYNAYNIVNWANLSPHNSSLSPEEAERINNTYSIELHLGAHGIPYEEGNDPSSKIARTTEVEYAAVEQLVESMRPGDVLLTELPGFRSQPGKPHLAKFETLIRNSHGKTLSDSGKRALREIIQYKEQYVTARRNISETARRQKSIDAWHYAEDLAELKNIQVVHADADALKLQYLKELEKHSRVRHSLVGKATGRSRGYDARNIVKDYALSHPDPQPVIVEPNEPARKPRLVVLFGRGHRGELEEAFGEAGLQITTIELENSTHEREHEENSQRIKRKDRKGVLDRIKGRPTKNRPTE
ncbi:MAG: hypothetical protein WBP26_04245 [Candidatus Saccharimonadales bacterium]